MKRIALLLAAVLLTLSFASCGLAGEKTFEADGMSITVKGMFTEQNELNEDQNLVLISPDAGVLAVKETFTDIAAANLDPEMSAKEYAAVVMKGNGQTGEPTEADGLTYFTYTNTSDDTEFTYMAFAYRASDAFWLVQAYCPTEDFEKQQPDFITWAKSVTFTESETR